jgi:hypothetical protein
VTSSSGLSTTTAGPEGRSPAERTTPTAYRAAAPRGLQAALPAGQAGACRPGRSPT